MRPSKSEFHSIRGLRYHVRTWGEPHQRPPLFLLHGWMDVSASFQFLVDCFRDDRYVIAPDWRGFGLTEWAGEGYWFPDYYADLDALLDLYAPHAPADLVGHSMGGVVACTYAGIRPERVAKVVSLEGFGLARTTPDLAPGRYQRWLDELHEPPRFRSYQSFAEVAARLKRKNPRLTDEMAAFLAQHWAQQDPSGEVTLASDPRHKGVNPYLFRLDELLACWRRVNAPVLWVFARESKGTGYLKDTPEQLAERKGAFRNLHEVWIEDCGHMLHHDQPQRLAQVIESFLNSADFASAVKSTLSTPRQTPLD
ncbi:MAG: alpha/beta hydrolase [Betaproteobacteria bacterium]|nr:alpha/beta hydrolase [Betaproteobacteria bacterium]